MSSAMPTPSIPPSIGPENLPPPSSLRHDARDRGTDDRAGMAVGVFLAVLVHATVAAASFRLGHREGNVARAQTAPRDEMVVSTQLLRRGGGLFDPRTVIHREAPVRAERAAPQAITPSRDPTVVALRPDAGAENYMAAITNRRVQGRGNQDLAEFNNRIAQMAAAESADPTASGPGDPTGSEVGTTTDPNQASRGAVAKLQEFLLRNIHRTQTLSDSDRRRVRFRLRIGADGVITTAELAQPSGNESLDNDYVAQAQRLVTQNAQIPNLTPEELAQLANRTVNVLVEPAPQ
jgi:hypothetical protein